MKKPPSLAYRNESAKTARYTRPCMPS
jgi:hypothetical protein